MSTSSISLFNSLPARPPTPPREVAKAIDDAISFLDDSNEVQQLISKAASLHASDVTPSSSQDNPSLSNLAKKVGFSPHPLYYKISRPDESSSPGSRLSKRSPSTTKGAKPLKSILKLSQRQPPSPEDLDTRLSYFSPAEPGSFATMLQSACLQLAGPSRSQRLDAYTNLNNALKAYDNVPDTAAMLQKIRLIMQFLSRDIVWKETADTLDAQIGTQALSLVQSILFTQELSEALDDDFRHFLIDRCINVLEQDNSPKQVVKLHMAILTQQRFRAPIMNTGRADRVLGALQSIEERYSGNGVVSARLAIYARLLEQAPPVMLTKASDWLPHVFHGLLSSIKDIRLRAMDTCTKAGVCLGQHAHASKVLMELFETEGEDGQPYFEYLKERLLQMISENEVGHYVPQIWSAIILMFRSKKYPLHKWLQFHSSLMIIQRCLNASDLKIRYQATLAWNKLVFVIMPDKNTPQSKMNMLPLPMISAMEKQSKDKSSKPFRQYALDSYCNLLHYGLRPGLSAEELDHAWESFVLPALSALSKAGGKGRHTACRILHGLLNGNTGVWNGNAALDPTPIKPQDLPKLDPKWVRTRLAKFLKVFEPFVMSEMWHSDNASGVVEATWNSLMQALANTRSQEVRTTMELKAAVALLVGLFCRLWMGRPLTADSDHWVKKYAALMDAMMTGIGTSSFTEDILATTDDNGIEVAPTPSHRASKRHSAPVSPLVILLGQFYRVPTGLVAGDSYLSSALAILDRALSSKASLAAALDLLCRSVHTWTDTSGLETESPIRREMWIVVARASIRVLETELKRSATQETQPLGHALRSGMDILTGGLVLDEHPDLINTLSECHDSLSEVAKSSAGEGGLVLAVTEPLAKALVDIRAQTHFSTKLHVATRMLERTVWPKNRQALEQARKSLWGVGLTPVKAIVFEPFEHVYVLVVDIMTAAYSNIGSMQGEDLEPLGSLFRSVLRFLQASATSLLATALRKVQFGFAAWIEDAALKTSGNEQATNLLRTGWQSLIQLLVSIPSKDNNLLKALEPLMVAGFSSPHRAIVNDTIIFWNESFGVQESLEYPAKLEAVLRARQVDAEISLPTFPDGDVEHIPASLPTFFDSQSQGPAKLHPPKLFNSTRLTLLSPRGQQHRLHNNKLATMSSPINRSVVSPSPAKKLDRRAASLTPKPRLRHDDSQIQFAPIDSSPLPPTDESQILTEHQKEVLARQHLDAQLFPEFSSSPVAHSTALPRGLPKRLDFGSKTSPPKDIQGYGTPTGLPDGNVLASDDMPSSPTPSSTRDASQGVMEVDDDQEEEVVTLDPPSSPPRASHEINSGQEDLQSSPIADPETTPLDLSEFPDLQQDAADTGNHNEGDARAGSNNEVELETDEMFSASEFHSDSRLPDEQLQLEDELARMSQEEPTKLPDDTQERVSGDTVPDEVSQDDVPEAAEDEVTRVEDSFVGAASANKAQSVCNTENSQQANKKRKRRSSKHMASKKQKPQSPLQRVWSTFGFGQQQEDDDDMGENIVVASSQRGSSPAVEEPEEQEANVTEEVEDVVVVERSMIVKEEPEIMQLPPKRGRGRPRKSATPTPSQSQSSPAKSLKRKASLLSNASFDNDDYAPTNFVKDTPAPAKARGRGRPPGRSNSSQPSREPSQSRPGSSGSSVAVAVLVSPTIVAKRPVVEEGETSVVQDKPILTPRSPRSILERLKGALSDFKGMILGPQEEREFDDVLFELRKETHEAGRRGRQA